MLILKCAKGKQWNRVTITGFPWVANTLASSDTYQIMYFRKQNPTKTNYVFFVKILWACPGLKDLCLPRKAGTSLEWKIWPFPSPRGTPHIGSGPWNSRETGRRRARLQCIDSGESASRSPTHKSSRTSPAGGAPAPGFWHQTRWLRAPECRRSREANRQALVTVLKENKTQKTPIGQQDLRSVPLTCCVAAAWIPTGRKDQPQPQPQPLQDPGPPLTHGDIPDRIRGRRMGQWQFRAQNDYGKTPSPWVPTPTRYSIKSGKYCWNVQILQEAGHVVFGIVCNKKFYRLCVHNSRTLYQKWSQSVPSNSIY